MPVLLALLLALPAGAARAQCPDGTPPPCGRQRPAVTAQPGSIAVLYFDNLSNDSADAYLAQGITEEVISRLGDVRRLTVKSRWAVRRYRGEAGADLAPAAVGRALGVAYLVTGSVQRGGGRLRVRAELARASSGDRVWGQQYERGDGDVLAITEDIARSVATGVAGRLLPDEASALAARPTRNPAAYDRLLRGNLLLAQRNWVAVRRAITEYEAATRLDPGLVSAWARIALGYAIWLDWGWSEDGRPAPDSLVRLGLASAARALELDSASSDAWMAWGYMQMWRDPLALEGAEDGFRRAVALDPHNAEAWSQLGDLLGLKGRTDEQVAAYRAALAAEPERPITMAAMSGALPLPRALAVLDSALALDPLFLVGYLNRSVLRARAGDRAGARDDIESMVRLAPPGSELTARSTGATALLLLGDTVAAVGAAREVLEDLPASGPLGMRMAIQLMRPLVAVADSTALNLLERVQPGAMLWSFLELGNLPAEIAAWPRVRRVIELSRPPWAPASAK